MRFVSNSAKLGLGNFRNAQEAIGASQEVVINGVKRTTTAESYIITPPIPIQFGQDELTSSDIKVAKAGLQWPGLPTEGDGHTSIDPAEFGRIGVWDSVTWQAKHNLSDGEREEAEQMVLSSSYMGQHYVKVEPIHAKSPWSTYDKTHHGKIASLAAELGCVDEALEYERENKNRPTVIEALSLQSEPATGEVVLA